jgi:hypothetical protein
MIELLQASLTSANLIPSGLLVFVFLYWVTVVLGVLDMDFLDLDLEVDVDAAADVSWLNSILLFFHLGRVPLMFFLTFLALPFWAITVLSNHYLGAAGTWLGYVVLVPALLVSLLIAKVLTRPFVHLFAAMEKEHAPKDQIVIGQICTMLLPATGTAIGQAAVKTKGAPILLNVQTAQGDALQKGQTAIILEYQPQNQVYLIEPYYSI